ncbi:hypothetical protein [Mycolicibacterium sarraceniae]|uniref:Uncharacterized protein n=1 Tax=Mycolicibacterium sarraceniae TaxID=1534348 RepID=A0A7I7SWL3_9MYCO|nr:hypothetical protein [Mycolicibacterium sarraceniae]BBY61404.1 hypothetical protein MSAR_45400 [Mycolicibacterium sarraceniae]
MIGCSAAVAATGTTRAARLTEIRLDTNASMTENIARCPRFGYVETHRGGQDGVRRVFVSKRL